VESEELIRSRRLLRLKGVPIEEDEEPVEQDDLERGNRALVLYERKKRDLELDRLEKRALQLLIEKLEKTG